MKKIAITALICALALIAATSAFAHPPKSLSVKWNAAGQILDISADHSVNDPEKHYVLSLTVFEGSKHLLQKQYTKQVSMEQFRDSVALKGLSSGTTVRIQVVCNIMGSVETEFTIP